MNDPQPSQSGSPTPASSAAKRGDEKLVLLALACDVLIAIVGGMACSWLVVKYGEWGTVSIWGLGAVGGFVSRKITSGPCKISAWILVAACILTLPAAEVSWLHWQTKQGAALNWFQCITLLPLLVKEYTLSVLISGVFTFFGAQSAYSQAGRRYRVVVVADES